MLRLKQRASRCPPAACCPGTASTSRSTARSSARRSRTWTRYERKHPDWGMPFGLPALTGREHDTLARWIEAGAPAARAAPLPAAYAQRVAQWEAFPQRRQPQGAPDEPLHLRALVHRAPVLRRPARRGVFSSWCARRRRPASRSRSSPRAGPTTTRAWSACTTACAAWSETPLAKTHMPYALNAARMARLKALVHRRAVRGRRPCPRTRRRSPPIPSSPSSSCRSRRATASCSTRRSSR